MSIHKNKTTQILALFVLASGFAGYQMSAQAQELKATAVISPTSVASAAGMNPQGTVSFIERGELVIVSGRITGLKPNGEHGFHVHEAGDCSAPDASSAKGHFNPAGRPHGHHHSVEGITRPRARAHGPRPHAGHGHLEATAL